MPQIRLLRLLMYLYLKHCPIALAFCWAVPLPAKTAIAPGKRPAPSVTASPAPSLWATLVAASAPAVTPVASPIACAFCWAVPCPPAIAAICPACPRTPRPVPILPAVSSLITGALTLDGASTSPDVALTFGNVGDRWFG